MQLRKDSRHTIHEQGMYMKPTTYKILVLDNDKCTYFAFLYYYHNEEIKYTCHLYTFTGDSD